MGILDDYTWVVWIDRNNKWHTSACGGYNKYANENARNFARILAGQSNGTNTLIGTAVVAYCIHAKNRYQAIKMAKKQQANHILK